jgi:hypothetical protein
MRDAGVYCGTTRVRRARVVDESDDDENAGCRVWKSSSRSGRE